MTKKDILDKIPAQEKKDSLKRLSERYPGKTKAEITQLWERSVLAGSCAFCGYGGGWLGEQGDESSQMLHSAVRTGTPGAWKYHTHPLGEPGSTVRWCGMCISGLAHKYQRYDDINFRALELSYKVRINLDGLRWEFWEASPDEREKLIKAGYQPDDTAIHLDKLHIERELKDIQNESFRRHGFDLTSRGWRP